MTTEGSEVTIDCSFATDDRFIPVLQVRSNGNGAYDVGEGFTDVDTPSAVNGEILAQFFLGG